MLILSRRIGEWIQIGPDIRVLLIDVVRNKAKIGIEADKSIPIMRSELLQKGAEDAHDPRTQHAVHTPASPRRIRGDVPDTAQPTDGNLPMPDDRSHRD